MDATGLCPYIGGRVLASVLAHHGVALRGCSVVELGCGVGLYGVIAARHAAHVVLTDGGEVCARAPLWCVRSRGAAAVEEPSKERRGGRISPLDQRGAANDLATERRGVRISSLGTRRSTAQMAWNR